MIRIAAWVAALVVAAASLVVQFRPSDTRLTTLPNVLALRLATHLRSPAHVIVIVEENKEYDDIVGNMRSAPYLNQLIKRGALFSHSYGVAHPSQPNYLALFAGVTNDNGDGCPPTRLDPSGVNLAVEAVRAHRSFAGYAEDLPHPGSRVCWSGNYARKHVPWADFSDVPDSEILPFSAVPAYAKLPTVSFIIPNLLNDMHSASIARGDRWLHDRVGPLVDWAMKHDSLIIITWDESDDTISNHIPTIFVGPMIRPGQYTEPVTHYRVLRTIEDLYAMGHAGASAAVPPIVSVWR